MQFKELLMIYMHAAANDAALYAKVKIVLCCRMV